MATHSATPRGFGAVFTGAVGASGAADSTEGSFFDVGAAEGVLDAVAAAAEVVEEAGGSAGIAAPFIFVFEIAKMNRSA